ncbi:MAG: nicotinate-nucleotide adenylyltransferase [Blautia sp.]|nr:nicotinate-nucleotide adenylyltransferase [Blautia sp.]
MMKNRKKVGIMGGTFDPIHLGHLILGEKSYEQLGLDKVLFMPAGNPPHKQEREGRATDAQRVEMVRLAISDNPHFELSLEEMNAEGFTYTYRTMERLRENNPDTDYYFIIGADSLWSFRSWMKPERISTACCIVTAVRNHIPVQELKEEIEGLQKEYEGSFILLDTMNIDVSSHMLREWFREGKSLRYYTPEAVIEYMKKEKVYL